ncbi:RNA/RNP complex-1-interacting phosphatase [Mastacembelus armatus]|uniref:RNA/RNP complex-1-interacting phosphatase n=1 Tax=Mastacembelus armatus TaxID=205130 RepID=A0A3Q3LU10_9TELE|nr:RNA/RNP complex-1-interacting phosphatase [Mastacembelus armatus]
MSRYNKKSGIPDRWLDYNAVGQRLQGTRFIAFKVPLKQHLNRQLPPADVFGPWELLDALNRENLELGLIIDLTYTKRYYSLQDLPESLLFVKISTAGHEVPSDNTILCFKRTVHRFLRDNAENDKLIGVHCTHGLNRTGYLICRYLIDVDGMDPKEAVELFNSSRGHDIERKNYLEDLQRGPKRSNEGMEESDPEPQRGCAVCRPCDDSEERQPRFSSSRPAPPRGNNHRPHHRPPRNALLPSPLFPAPFYPPMGAPIHPYQWTPPHHDSQWSRGPPSSDMNRPRYPPQHSESGPGPQLQADRRRGPFPAALPRYSPRWGSGPTTPRDPGWSGPFPR